MIARPVIEPLVHDVLSGRIEAWFHLWEAAPTLMIRCSLVPYIKSRGLADA
jgi:hypothetical protein